MIQQIKVGHVFNEFCPKSPIFRYWPVVNPHVGAAVYCYRRTNEDLFPHSEVYTERFAEYLRRFPRGPWRRATGILASAAHRYAWQHFLRRSGVNVLHVQFGDKAVRFLPMLERTKLPLVVTFRGSDINCATYSEEMCRNLPKLFARTALCHFVSHDLRRKGIALGCPPGIAKTIHVGAPQRESNEACVGSARIDDCRFFCIAGLVPCKGHETLLTAFKGISNVLPRSTLHLIGDGPLRHRLEWMTKSLRLDNNVKFHGQLANEKVVSTLQSEADVVVLASQKADNGSEEGLPTCLQEAGSLGIPCIGTECGGISELIVHGKTGLVVPQRDARLLESEMLTLAQSPEMRRNMGKLAFQRVRENFNLDKFYRQMHDCYHSLVVGT